MEDGHPREADEIELIPNLAFQQDRESGTPELAPDRVPPDASTSRSLPRWSCHWRWEHKQRRTAGRQRESVDGEASQNLTHRNSTMRDAAAPTMLSVAAEQLSSARTVLPGRWPSSSTPMVVASELRPSGSPAALAELRHARGGGGGGRAQTAWVPATLAELWHARGDGQAPPAQLQSLATGAELRPAQLPAAATMLNPPRVPPQLMGSSPGPRGALESPTGEMREKMREREKQKEGHLQVGQGQKLSFPSTFNSTWMGIWTEWYREDKSKFLWH